MRRALPSSQELPGVLELHLLLPGDRAGVRATALNAGGLGYWNHPGGRYSKGGHIQDLALACFLPGGMNLLRLSNPPGYDRRASRLWPLGPQHYRPGPIPAETKAHRLKAMDLALV